MTTEHPMIQNIERSLHFIQTELQEDRAPSLDSVAAASGMSKFHFHRIFKLVTGETCAMAITRLRLARGAATIQDASTSITEAAFAAGYSSSQAFAKAIKRELSTSASSLRSDPERLSDTIRTLLEPGQAASSLELPPTRIEICSLEPLEVILIRTEDKFPDLADTFWNLVEAVGDPQNIRAVLGMPHRDIASFEEDDFIFDCAVLPAHPVETIPSAGRRHTIAHGTYLLARHTGPDAALPHTLDALYTAILTHPDIHLADAPCIHHFIDDPEEVDERECRTDIYLKIELPK